MKLTSIKQEAIRYTLERLSEELGAHILETGSFRDKVKTYGVNWGAYGTVSTAETFDFAEKLSKAATIAGFLNGLDIETKWADDEDDYSQEQFLSEAETAGFILNTQSKEDFNKWAVSPIM